MKRELVFTAFNRPDYLRQTIHSWNQADNIEDWNVSYSLEPSVLRDQMIAEFNNLQSGSMYGDVNKQVQGVLVNPYLAMGSAFDIMNDFAVLAEDDIVVSSDILEYFDWAMKYYKEDKSVLGVLAFSRIPLEASQVDSSAASRTKVFCPLVWGTWRDRWEEIIQPNWDLNYSSGKPDGSEAGWDWNMMRLAVKHNMDFIYPHASRSDHIGKFGGTHTSEASFPESQAPTFRDFHDKTKEFNEIFLRDWKLNDYYPGTN